MNLVVSILIVVGIVVLCLGSYYLGSNKGYDKGFKHGKDMEFSKGFNRGFSKGFDTATGLNVKREG